MPFSSFSSSSSRSSQKLNVNNPVAAEVSIDDLKALCLWRGIETAWMIIFSSLLKPQALEFFLTPYLVSWLSLYFTRILKLFINVEDNVFYFINLN